MHASRTLGVHLQAQKSSALSCLASAVAKIERQIEGQNRHVQKANISHVAKDAICVPRNRLIRCRRTSQGKARQETRKKTCSSACFGIDQLHVFKRVARPMGTRNMCRVRAVVGACRLSFAGTWAHSCCSPVLRAPMLRSVHLTFLESRKNREHKGNQTQQESEENIKWPFLAKICKYRPSCARKKYSCKNEKILLCRFL